MPALLCLALSTSLCPSVPLFVCLSWSLSVVLHTWDIFLMISQTYYFPVSVFNTAKRRLSSILECVFTHFSFFVSALHMSFATSVLSVCRPSVRPSVHSDETARIMELLIHCVLATSFNFSHRPRWCFSAGSRCERQ